MQGAPRSAVSIRFLAVLVLATAVVVPFAGRAPAQQTSNTQLTDIERQQSEVTAEIAAARKEIIGLRSRRHELEQALAGLSGELNLASDRLAQAQSDADRQALAILLLAAKIQKTERRLDDAKAATRRSAVLLYVRSDGSAMLNLIGSADGAGAFVEGSHYLGRISTKRQGDIRRAGLLRAQLVEQEAKLDVARQAADAALAAASQERSRIEGLYARQRQTVADAAAAEQLYNKKLATLTAKQTQLEAEFRAVSDRIAAELARLGNTPSYGNGTFIRPIPGAPITSPFGYRTDPITGVTTFHSGVDFGASCGTPIKAAGTGAIIFAAYDGGYGNATIINHGAGRATLYAHQSVIAVSVGQVVQQGQVIGYVGTTGRSTGCHLHFEVRINGTPVDPMGYL
jgi:murein DD-endopeptidase MepM/ murein hydrolase activator NlpD